MRVNFYPAGAFGTGYVPPQLMDDLGKNGSQAKEKLRYVQGGGIMDIKQGPEEFKRLYG